MYYILPKQRYRPVYSSESPDPGPCRISAFSIPKDTPKDLHMQLFFKLFCYFFSF